MAAGIIPPPGSKYGPCLETCEHRDCRLTRDMAATVCSFCSDAIGYETRFYRHDGTIAHTLCVERERERQWAERDESC